MLYQNALTFITGDNDVALIGRGKNIYGFISSSFQKAYYNQTW